MSTNTAPFTVQAKLTQIAMAVVVVGMIADQVCPRVQVDSEKFIYTKMTTEEAFTIPDTRVGRTGKPNTVEFSGQDVNDSTEDYGLDDPVPNKDIKNAVSTNYDPLATAADRTETLVQLAREQRVANLYFSLSTYSAALRSTLSGTSQWSDYVNSDPFTAITTAIDSMLITPNIMVIGRLAWTKLRSHPKIVAAILNAGGVAGGQLASGKATKQQVAELFELDAIYVGQAFYNSAKKGQTASMQRLWGKHCALLRIDPNVKSTKTVLPTFAFTAQWGDKVAGTIPSPNIGLMGGETVRVGEHVKELVSWQDAGYFFQNVVA